MAAQRLGLTGGVPPASKASLGLNVTCISYPCLILVISSMYVDEVQVIEHTMPCVVLRPQVHVLFPQWQYKYIETLEIGIHAYCQAMQAVSVYMSKLLILDRLTAQQSLVKLCLPAVC